MAMKRLIMFVINFVLFAHIFACLWIITAQLDTSEDHWMNSEAVKKMD